MKDTRYDLDLGDGVVLKDAMLERLLPGIAVQVGTRHLVDVERVRPPDDLRVVQGPALADGGQELREAAAVLSGLFDAYGDNDFDPELQLADSLRRLAKHLSCDSCGKPLMANLCSGNCDRDE